MERVWNKIDSRDLVNGANWEDAQSTVKSMVFGVMVELAQHRVNRYKSDLYHDAIWLKETLNGPMQFDWIARESGTFIGDVVQHINQDEWSDAAKYRFDIKMVGDHRWVLDIYESVTTGDWREEIPGTGVNYYGQPVSNDDPLDVSCTGYFDKGSLQHEGITCPVHEGLPSEIPTLRIESNRKEINMDSILDELREKLDEANSARDEAYDKKSELDDLLAEFDTYIDDVENLINSLDDLPTVSVYFEADIRFDS